jgi:hypothetical protein
MNIAPVQNYIIKIVGLLGIVNTTKDFSTFLEGGYILDVGPKNDFENIDVRKVQSLRDYFYPNFRNLMFLDDRTAGNYRFVRNSPIDVSFTSSKTISPFLRESFQVTVDSSDLYVFENSFGLFSLSIKFKIPTNFSNESLTLEAVSSLSNIVRNFHSLTDQGIEWHEWISSNILCGKLLRGENVIADDYSGSKFKLYTIIDLNHDANLRNHILYDLGTNSPLGSSLGEHFMSPNKDYFNSIIQKRIACFQNWEALPLFDSFTCVGVGQLQNTWQYESWDLVYFRIYLFRLYFKFSLFRYNSEVYSNADNIVLLRDQFENFLNRYNFSHISFNFLANEIFKKSGEALELDTELVSFREMINNLSKSIQERKQARTNLLLQAVTVLTSISSIGPIFIFLQQVQFYFKWSDLFFYCSLSVILFSMIVAIFIYLKPDKLKKIVRKTNSN